MQPSLELEHGFESVSCGSFFTLSKFETEPVPAGTRHASSGGSGEFSPANTENFAARSIKAALEGKVKLLPKELGR